MRYCQGKGKKETAKKFSCHDLFCTQGQAFHNIAAEIHIYNNQFTCVQWFPCEDEVITMKSPKTEESSGSSVSIWHCV